MTTAEAEFAPAKINLALHVTGRRPDGYHLLESLVVFADFGDEVSVELAEDLTLSVSGPMANGVPTDASNLVLKAAELVRQLRGVTQGAAISLTKKLPHGAGLGGGSSDAAAVIRALARLWNVEPLTVAEALPLGADLPVCLSAPTPMMMSGIGEILTPAPDLPELWLVVVTPDLVLNTGDVFRRFDETDQGELGGLTPVDRFEDFKAFETWLNRQRNDLTHFTGKRGIAREIEEVLTAFLETEGCVNSDMSGSGSACWALFRKETQARVATYKLGKRKWSWWARVTRIS